MIATTGRATPHPALDRVVAVWPDDVAVRAAAGLRTLLAGRLAADPAGAWGSSALTGDGFPVEIGIVTTDDRLRYTVEPGGPRLDPSLRLDLAARAIGGLGGPVVPDRMLDAARAMQQGSLRYGAWIGCRHGPADSRYKLYAEVGEEAHPDSEAARFGLLAPRLPGRPARLRMVACTPATGEGEAYYRIPDLDPAQVPRLLAAAGLESRAAELLDLLAVAYGHPFTGRLPGESVGVSYAVSPDGQPLSVTLFFFARVFWGSDDRIRRCLARLAPDLGWDDRRYRALTDGLAGAGRRTRHGLLGVTVAGHAPPVLSVGLRP
jgi:hypothetical protein